MSVMKAGISLVAVKDLRALFGKDLYLPDQASFGEDVTKVYGKDCSTYPANPSAVVFPRNIEQVIALVKSANHHDFAIVPSGGRTGLSGGAVAMHAELVVSFDKMNRVKQYSELDRSVVCEAGVITAQLQEFAKNEGLYYPIEFAASGSSQIGGNIATNAGGINVIRYGMTRDWVLGLTVVTGRGEVLRLNRGLKKNNSGYDFRHLFIGSEGSLGLIVEATMALTTAPNNSNVLLVGVQKFSAIMDVLKVFQSSLTLNAFEFFSELALQKVLAKTGLNRPFANVANYYVLIDFEVLDERGGAHDFTEVEKLFQYCLERSWVSDGVISQSEKQKRELWRLREEISDTIAQWTPYKNDISTLVSKVPDFLSEVETVVKQEYPKFEIIWFGHIGDGNIHLNILKPVDLEQDEFLQQCAVVSNLLFEIVAKYDGSISAEHGVGLLKKDYLASSLGGTSVDYMREIKKVFDPKGILNPGKIFS